MKRNSSLLFTDFGNNALFQAADNNNGSGSSSHKKHQKWSSEHKAWVWCLFCQDPEYTQGSDDSGPSGYSIDGGYSVDGGYGGCPCTCSGCHPAEPDEIKTSEDLVEKFSFSNDDKGKIRETVTNVGRQKWGSRALDSLGNYPVDLDFSLDSNLDQYGQTLKEAGFTQDGLTGEPKELEDSTNNLKISFGVSGSEDYVTVAHELFHGLDVSTTFNTAGTSEMGARMFETILKDYDGSASGSSSFDTTIELPARALLQDLVENDWNVNRVSHEKWDDLRDALYDIEKEEDDGFGNKTTVKAYPEVENATLSDFDPKTLKEAYQDYTAPTNGNDSNHGNSYYGYIPYSYGMCNCNCPGCLCNVDKQ